MESRILDVQRFNVVGSSGSGKSTFSQKLAKVLGVPHIAMDEIFWQPGWQHLGDEAFALALEAALAPPGWVLDGNYTRTIPVKWPRAQGVIWLDFGFGVTLWRSVTRAMARSWTGEELWEGTGNRESWRRSFCSRESILWWMVTNFWRVRRKYESWQGSDAHGHLVWVRLRTPGEAAQFLAQIQAHRALEKQKDTQ